MSGNLPDVVHNERVKLLATTMNNLALAFIIGGFVAPVVAGKLRPDWHGLSAVAWIGIGIGLHFGARYVLRRLR